MTQRIPRRRFLRDTAAGVTAFLGAPWLGRMTLSAQPGVVPAIPGLADNHVLVIIQLDGGNDGLNTVVPYGDDIYYQRRPHIAIPAGAVHQLDEHMGLHPELVELGQLYDAGQLAIVQNVGYPDQNRSHFTSSDIWSKAAWFDPTEPAEVLDGWVGRYFERYCDDVVSPMLGLRIGRRATLAFASASPRSVTIENPAIMEWTGYDTELRGLQGRSASVANANDPLERIRQLGRQTVSLADRIHAAQRIASRADYPPFRLSQSLRLIGQMIVAGLPTRVFYVSITGFDTHVEQLRGQRGILQELSQAVGAFARDMRAAGQWDRTLVMTVSEFGRRVAENGTLGTDHGSASAMFLAGGSVVPGFHGGIPDLGDLDDGDVRHRLDFRAVYASVLRQWFGVDPDPVLFGHFEPVELLRV
ncbi:MAG: DUF1501 domain-containing protein [Acidobacteria bacterium]|nr:DUF1501 domain-containing protein [Acidobacteriota bacterium]